MTEHQGPPRSIWRTEDGTYTDQFGREHKCTFVLEQTVVEPYGEEMKPDGYGGRLPKYYYRDYNGRKFTVTIGINGSGSYREIHPNTGVYWTKANDRYNGPYLTPDGKREVEPLDPNGDVLQERYKEEQAKLDL